MSRPPAWTARLRSRWRRWLRDPAGFGADLSSPPLRAYFLGQLHGVTRFLDAVDARTRRARAQWKTGQVALRHMEGRDGPAFAFLDRHANPPDVWPDRIHIPSTDVRAMVCAFDAEGELIAVSEIGPDQPGVLMLGGRAAAVVDAIDPRGGALPARLDVAPIGRLGHIDILRAGGLRMPDALKVVWPPMERRPAEPSPSAYRLWSLRNEPGGAELDAVRTWATRHPELPTVSILMPVHDPRPEHLQAAIDSVVGQAYGRWRLCIADDGSVSPEVRRILDRTAADPRVRLVRHDSARGVAAATNAAMSLAEGDIAVFLDHDDLLAPHALAAIGWTFAAHPDAVAVYSDEDSVDARGRRSAPLFKPDFDGERLLAQNYQNHAFATRLDLLRRLGGLREGLDGSQDHDLALRIVEAGAGRIVHIPHVLYHWRIYPGAGTMSQRASGQADGARLKAVGGHLERTGVKAAITTGARGRLRIERALPEPLPEVLAIIPTRDRPGLLEACVTGLLEQTDYPALKLCVVDNGSRAPDALDLLARLEKTPRVGVLRIDAPFNFSALNNAAAARATSPLLAFVNDDILVVEPHWLRTMVALALEPDVGAVGAKLFYPDGRLQHAGIVLGLGPQKVAGHEFRGAPGDSPGPQYRLLVTREASAVTAACMVARKAAFDAVGGFDEAAFPVAFNDVDLCLRLRAAGLRILWTPEARLMHLESATRSADKAGVHGARFAAETARMRERWGKLLDADPYYNPNLTLEDESFGLAPRSRARLPWR